MPKDKTILVTGGGGYLGSVLVPKLLNTGYKVKVFDRFFFGRQTLDSLKSFQDSGQLELIEGDTRFSPKDIFTDVYAVCDLAALSNDPAGELDPERTFDINTGGRSRTATQAKEMGVERYVLASSCSVYGFQDGLIEESAPLQPLTTYARANVLAEQAVLPLASKNFSVTSLRQGTLFGPSPRMRFDLVVNIMTHSILKDKKVVVAGGTQWRPLLHVADSARAFIAVLEAPSEKVSGKIFNVGSTAQNYQMADLGKKIHEAIPLENELVILEDSFDARSYQVSCEKIKTDLSFTTTKSPVDGALEVFKGLTDGSLVDDERTRTILWYKGLLLKNPQLFDQNV